MPLPPDFHASTIEEFDCAQTHGGVGTDGYGAEGYHR